MVPNPPGNLLHRVVDPHPFCPLRTASFELDTNLYKRHCVKYCNELCNERGGFCKSLKAQVRIFAERNKNIGRR